MGNGLKPDQNAWLTELTLVQAEDPPPPESSRSALVRESFLAPLADAFSRHEAKLARYAARITGDADTARDVVQDVFARLCREPPTDMNGQLTPWLYAACRNRAIDVRRKASRMTFAADAEMFAIAEAECGSSPRLSRGLQPARSEESQTSRGLQSARREELRQASRRRNSSSAESARTLPSGVGAQPAVDPASEAAIRDEAAKVLRMLAKLPSSQQEAVCLRFSCGLSYKEIAAVMELSVSHVGALLHNAIAALRERMGERQ